MPKQRKRSLKRKKEKEINILEKKCKKKEKK